MNNYPDKRLIVNTVIKDNDTAIVMNERFGNDDFTIVQFNTGNISELNGLYHLRDYSLIRKTSAYHEGKIVLNGIYSYHKWIVSIDEITTDWDDIYSDDFSAAITGWIEQETAGSWARDAGDNTYEHDGGEATADMYSTIWTDDGDYPPTSDVELELTVLPTDGTGTLYCTQGLVSRLIKPATSGIADDCYLFLIYPRSDVENAYARILAMTGGSSYVLGIIYGDDLNTDYGIDLSAVGKTHAIKLKLKAQGNRFDCFLTKSWEHGVDDPETEWIHIRELTSYDDEFKAGWHGIGSRGNYAGKYDDFVIKVLKPAITTLPVGSYSVNAPLMPYSSKLNDEITADGITPTVVYPGRPLQFKTAIGQLASLPGTEVLYTVDDYSSQSTNGLIRDHSGNDRHLVSQTSYQVLRDSGHPSFPKSIFHPTIVTRYYEWADDDNGFDVNAGYTVHVLIKILSSQSKYDYFFHLYNNSTADQICGLMVGETYTGLYIEPIGEAASLHGLGSTRPGVDPWTYKEWHLITIAFDGVDTFTLYVDGVKKSSYTHASTISFESASKIRTFGWNNSSYGSIQETAFVHILSRDQGDSEIASYYDSLDFIDPTGGEVKVWDTNGEDGLWDYLVLDFAFNEDNGVKVNDHSKYKDVGYFGGVTAPSWQSDSYRKEAKTSLSFDGMSSHVYFGAGDSRFKLSDSHNTEMTISYWAKIDSTDTEGYTISKPWNSSGEYNYKIYYTGDYIEVCLEGATAWNTSTSISRLKDDQWHHYVLTVEAAGSQAVKFYIDGEEVYSGTHTISNWTPSAGDSGLHVAIGTLYPYGAGWAGNVNFSLTCSIDDVVFYDKVLSADRIKWLYENSPNMIIEKDWTNPATGNTLKGWTRVYDPDHSFVGHMIVDNGIIRLDQHFRRVDGSNLQSVPQLTGYSNGQWVTSSPVYGPHNYTSSDSVFYDYDYLTIKELSRYKVVLEGRNKGDIDWISFEFVISQSPLMLVKATDWKLSGNTYAYFGTTRATDNSATTYGYDTGARFAIINLDTVHDQDIATGNVIGSNTEGLVVGFSTQQDFLWVVFFDEKGTGSWHSQWGSNAGYPITVIADSGAIDFDRDVPPVYWANGLLPFKTSELHGDSDNYDRKVDTDIEADGDTANGYRLRMLNSGNSLGESYVEWDKELPAGGYRVFIRIKDFGSSSGIRFGLYNTSTSSWIGNYGYVAPGGAVYTWYYADVVVSDDDEGHTALRCANWDPSGDDDMFVDQILIVPVSNGKNFPLDVRNQLLANTIIDRSISN